MTKLNSAYLVVIDNTPGLEEAQRISLESSLELTRLNNCLLSSHESSLDVATRYIFFSVANHFMMNTAETRLERLTYILTGIAPSTDLSIKEYYNKLMNECRIYNLMANPHQIPRYLCLELFKINIINVHGAHSRYQMTLTMLDEKDKDYTANELVQKWNTIWIHDRKSIGPPQTVYQASTTYIPKSTKGTTMVMSKGDGKPKVTKDDDGKPFCWQFLENKQCTYGSKCKFSHKTPSKDSLGYTPQERMNLCHQQMYQVAYQAATTKANKKLQRRVARSVAACEKAIMMALDNCKCCEKLNIAADNHSVTSNSSTKSKSKRDRSNSKRSPPKLVHGNTFKSAVSNFRDYMDGSNNQTKDAAVANLFKSDTEGSTDTPSDSDEPGNLSDRT